MELLGRVRPDTPSWRAGSRRCRCAAGALIALSVAGCAGGPDPAPPVQVTVTVMAASSVGGVFTELARRFEEERPGVRVAFEFGNGAAMGATLSRRPDVDLFAAADRTAMHVAESTGAVAEPVVFARNHVVLAVPAGNPAGVRGLGDLTRPDLRVGLCAPEASCGRAADALLHAAGVRPVDVRRAPDAGAVTRILTTAEVDAGVVFRTDVAASRGWVDRVEGEDEDRALAREAGATEYLLADVRGVGGAPRDPAEVAATRDFRELILSERGRQVLTEAGFLGVG